MPAPVLFVRHAMPVTDPERRSPEWHLGPDGRQAADQLARRLELPGEPVVVTSPEPKAVETAAAIAEHLGVDATTDADLAEAQRSWVGESYRAVAHRYLEGAQPDGWEERAAVAARVAAAVARAAAAGESPVVVTHGLALALHLEAALPPGFDARAFWSRLAFPDAWWFDATEMTLARAGRS